MLPEIRESRPTGGPVAKGLEPNRAIAGGSLLSRADGRRSVGGRALPRIVLFLVLAGVCAGCFSVRVRSDWDPGVEFESLQRYAWLEPPEREQASPFADNDLLRKRIRIAVERTLDERGFRRVEDPDAADFLVTWNLELEERVRVDGSSAGLYYHTYPFWGGYSTGPTVRNYQESTLLIDVLDPKSRQLIWRGWGSGIVGTRDRDRDQAHLEDGVRQILDAFPPAPDAEHDTWVPVDGEEAGDPAASDADPSSPN